MFVLLRFVEWAPRALEIERLVLLLIFGQSVICRVDIDGEFVPLVLGGVDVADGALRLGEVTAFEEVLNRLFYFLN